MGTAPAPKKTILCSDKGIPDAFEARRAALMNPERTTAPGAFDQQNSGTDNCSRFTCALYLFSKIENVSVLFGENRVDLTNVIVEATIL